jgi:hypothetical protein
MKRILSKIFNLPAMNNNVFKMHDDNSTPVLLYSHLPIYIATLSVVACFAYFANNPDDFQRVREGVVNLISTQSLSSPEPTQRLNP